MSMCRVFSCVVGRGCLLWPVRSLGKTLVAFALLHSVLQGQICLLLQVSLNFLLLHSSPLWWKGHLFWVLVLEGLVSLHRTVQLQLLQCCWLGHSLDCHKSAVSLSMLNVSLNVSPLTQWLPQYGDRTAASVPPPTMGRSSPTNTSVFSPRSFILWSLAWFYIFFSTGQVLLSTLSWCSACTSVSEGVFLIYPWREMYSMSTYSSTILFSLTYFKKSISSM